MPPREYVSSNKSENKLESGDTSTPALLDNVIQSVISLPDKDNGPGAVKILIRFEERKDTFIWANPEEICFVKSADHYIHALIKCDNKLRWTIRHSTIKELVDLLPETDFIRLNRFYLLNLVHFFYIDETKKMLYFKNNFSINIPHRISPFLCHSLISTHT